MVAAAAPDARSSCALTAVSDHSALSANRAGVLNAQSWRLIIVWLEVRVLPAPAQTGFSQFSANRPELAAICVRILARMLGLEVAKLEIRRAEDIAPAFDVIKGRADALYVGPDPLMNANRVLIHTLSLFSRSRLHQSNRLIRASFAISGSI